MEKHTILISEGKKFEIAFRLKNTPLHKKNRGGFFVKKPTKAYFWKNNLYY